MSIRKFEVEVTSYYEVEIDTSKFTKQVMDGFEGVMYEFGDIAEHAGYIATMLHRGNEDSSAGVFLEGYGDLSKAGVYAERAGEDFGVTEQHP